MPVEDLCCHPADFRVGDHYIVSFDHCDGPVVGFVGQLIQGEGHDTYVFTDARSGQNIELGPDCLRVVQLIDGPWLTDAEAAGCHS